MQINSTSLGHLMIWWHLQVNNNNNNNVFKLFTNQECICKTIKITLLTMYIITHSNWICMMNINEAAVTHTQAGSHATFSLSCKQQDAFYSGKALVCPLLSNSRTKTNHQHTVFLIYSLIYSTVIWINKMIMLMLIGLSG